MRQEGLKISFCAFHILQQYVMLNLRQSKLRNGGYCLLEQEKLDFEAMTDEEFDAWLGELMLLEAEITIHQIENDPNFKDAPGLSQAAYENLIMKAKAKLENS